MAADPSQLKSPLNSRVLALLKVANRDGVRVTVVSACRSREEQAELYRRYQAGTGNYAAPPGNSKHETCEAVDFGGDLALVAQLAPTFGLVNTGATFPQPEPWHYEAAPGTALLSGGDAQRVGAGIVVDAVTDPVGAAKGALEVGKAAAGEVAGAISDPLGTLVALLARLLSGSLWLRIGAALLGLVLVAVGFAIVTRGAAA